MKLNLWKNTLSAHNNSIGGVLGKALVPAAATWLLLNLTFVFPTLNSTRPPYFDLTSAFSQWAFWLSLSGGKYGLPVLGVLAITLVVTRRGLARRRRLHEAIILVTIAAACGGGGGMLNENVLKEAIKAPRPNIMWLAGEGGFLGMDAEEFYAVGNKEERSKLLESTIDTIPLPLSPSIKSYWIEQTGYSLPSGHAYAAMFFTTFFLMVAASIQGSRRLRLLYLLLPWALTVSYTRCVLRVHTPTDIVIGGFLGLLIGFAAWTIALHWIQSSREKTAK